ncbi:MAG TPA: formyltransferase family protein, partial [Candidatus Cloacimonadota bacterium]|nr:formyltransferase family protein [Candidatus Cloacimonadota bacterium]
LAGFMRKLSEQFLDTINTPLINIHPALLPKYGGKGMYGSNVHNAVFTAGEKISGATVHYVNKNYDEGDIIMQQSVDITDCQSPEEIGKKVLAIEHQIYGAAIEKILLGRTSLLKD